jgi:hypothetical protein
MTEDNKKKEQCTIQNVSDRLTVVFIIWMACLAMMFAMLYQQQEHNNRVDEIFREYELEMEKLHNGN